MLGGGRALRSSRCRYRCARRAWRGAGWNTGLARVAREDPVEHQSRGIGIEVDGGSESLNESKAPLYTSASPKPEDLAHRRCLSGSRCPATMATRRSGVLNVKVCRVDAEK